MKRIFLIFMMLILSVTLIGCKNKYGYADDEIIISIKSDYRDEFINREPTNYFNSFLLFQLPSFEFFFCNTLR